MKKVYALLENVSNGFDFEGFMKELHHISKEFDFDKRMIQLDHERYESEKYINYETVTEKKPIHTDMKYNAEWDTVYSDALYGDELHLKKYRTKKGLHAKTTMVRFKEAVIQLDNRLTNGDYSGNVTEKTLELSKSHLSYVLGSYKRYGYYQEGKVYHSIFRPEKEFENDSLPTHLKELNDDSFKAVAENCLRAIQKKHYRAADMVLRSKDDTEECVAEMYCIYLSNPEKYNGHKHLLYYMKAIAGKAVQNIAKERGIHFDRKRDEKGKYTDERVATTLVTDSLDRTIDEEEDMPLSAIIPSHMNTEKEGIHNCTYNVSNVYDFMPSHLRLICDLKEEGCSEREIAAIMGISRKVVRNYIATIRRGFTDFGMGVTHRGNYHAYIVESHCDIYSTTI